MHAWLELRCGAAGDMLLGALLDAGAPLEAVAAAVAAVGVPVTVRTGSADRAGTCATRIDVDILEEQPPHRTWAGLRRLLADAPLDDAVRDRALRVFGHLAEAEGAAHGTPADDVHFHEVGAHDAVADIVGVCAAVAALGITRVTATPVALGGGQVLAAHGRLAVPVPAVRELIARHRLVTVDGPEPVELCTPTGAALLAELVDVWSDEPPPAAAVGTGHGAGTRDFPGRANVVTVRLLPEPAAESAAGTLRGAAA